MTCAAHRPWASVAALAVARAAPCAFALGAVGSSTIANATTAPGRGAPVGPSSTKPSVPIPPGGTEIDSGVAARVRGVVGVGGAASGPPHAAAVPAQAASAAHKTRAAGERRTAPGMTAAILARFGAPPSGRAAARARAPPVDELWMASGEVRLGR